MNADLFDRVVDSDGDPRLDREVYHALFASEGELIPRPITSCLTSAMEMVEHWFTLASKRYVVDLRIGTDRSRAIISCREKDGREWEIAGDAIALSAPCAVIAALLIAAQ